MNKQIEKRTKPFLETLIDKNNANKESGPESELLNDFVKHEFEISIWNSSQMGTRENISATLYPRIKRNVLNKRASGNYYKYAVAASLTLLLCLGILLQIRKDVPEIIVSTKYSPDSVSLEDGTVVYMAANTTFKYPKNFKGPSRSVSLIKGNAFFKVAKDPSLPFIISSGKLKTKVLGTSFHIRLENSSCRVSVISGSVEVSSADQKVELTRNEEAVYTAAGITKQDLSNTSIPEWYANDTKFNNVSLSDVLELLRLKFGVDFKVHDKKILKTRLTIYITSGLSLDDILDQINYISNLKLTRYDNIIEVKK